MISLKYVRLCSFETPLAFDEISALISKNLLQGLPPELTKTFGWSGNFQPVVLESPNRNKYLISRFEGLLRSVPKELIDRKVNAERKRLEGRGEVATKQHLEAYAEDVAIQLRSELEPEQLECYLIVLASGQIILSSNKRAWLDELVLGLQFVLSAADVEIRPTLLRLSRASLKLLALNHQSIDASVLQVAVKQSRASTKLDPGGVAPAFYRQTLSNGDVERVTFCRDDLLYVSITSKGTIASIVCGDTFLERWREYGSGEESEMLDKIRTGIWLDELLGLVASIETDAERLVGSSLRLNEEESPENQMTKP